MGNAGGAAAMVAAPAGFATALVAGFLVSISLIAAIGAQNAFVLRQGLRREYVGLVVAICALSDAVLIAAGVAGFGAASAALPWLGTVMRLGGAAFLIVYGALRLRSALRGGQVLDAAAGGAVSRGRVVLTCLALTWANPHVYLDTLALLGAVSAQYAPQGLAFGIGAVLASAGFFTALGYGARLLRPLFQRPIAWVWLDLLIAGVMWMLAAGLLRGLAG